jgi:hypothetical protein
LKAGDVVQGLARRDHRPLPGDHDGELRLGVDVLDAGTDDDVVVRPRERARRLREEERLRRGLLFLLGGVLPVVHAEADDLARGLHRGVETRFLEGEEMLPGDLGRVVREVLDLGEKAAAEKVFDRDELAAHRGAHVEDHVPDHGAGPSASSLERNELHGSTFRRRRR